jgi:hypothetical protein
MPPKNATAAAVGKTLEDRREQAREAALKELKALRNDLNTLEAVLTGRRKKSDFSPFDVVHGAFEIFRHAASVFDAEDMLATCARELEAAKALEYLQRHGANELVKPAGWHWISPRGEMHFLGKADDTDKAAEKLAGLIQSGKRPRRRDKQAEAEAGDTPAEATASPEA